VPVGSLVGLGIVICIGTKAPGSLGTTEGTGGNFELLELATAIQIENNIG